MCGFCYSLDPIIVAFRLCGDFWLLGAHERERERERNEFLLVFYIILIGCVLK